MLPEKLERISSVAESLRLTRSVGPSTLQFLVNPRFLEWCFLCKSRGLRFRELDILRRSCLGWALLQQIDRHLRQSMPHWLMGLSVFLWRLPWKRCRWGPWWWPTNIGNYLMRTYSSFLPDWLERLTQASLASASLIPSQGCSQCLTSGCGKSWNIVIR